MDHQSTKLAPTWYNAPITKFIAKTIKLVCMLVHANIYTIYDDTISLPKVEISQAQLREKM